jgi:ribonuclease HI
MNKFVIYTDGSSRGNPGPGGWAAIIINHKPVRLSSLAQGDFVTEIGGREEMTTNNRMEMRAAIEALRLSSLAQGEKISRVEIFSDSEYLLKGMTEWIQRWQNNNWRTKDKREVLNKDLWQELLKVSKNKNIEWKKVLAHSGHKENERCDEIATSFADGLKVDLYEGPKENYKFHI